MKLHLDFSSLIELADRIMLIRVDFSLTPYSRRLWLREIESGIVNDDLLDELRNNDEHTTLIGKHLSDLARIGFMLTMEDRKILGKYGAWMEALIYGHISPCTLGQKRFILTAEKILEPKNEIERLWQSVMNVRRDLSVGKAT
ncbi:DUF413 domain-containing protein [Aeromonas veronii]